MSVAFPLGKLEFDPPSNWTQTFVGQICDENDGDVQTGPFGSQLHASDYSDEGVPLVMPQDMADGKILTTKIARVDSSHVERLSKHMLRTGDIVFSRRGDVARFAIVNCAEQGWLCGTGSVRIRLNSPLIDTLFLRRFLQLDSVGKWLNHQAKGITMPNLNTGILRALPLYFPSLPEQRQIAAILDKADAVRRKREESIRLTEELLRSTFLEMFGDVATAPAKPLAELAEVVSGVTKGRKLNGRAVTVPYLRVANVQDGFLNLDEIKTIEALPSEVEALALKAGDIVMTEGGDHDKLGRGAIWTGAVQNCIHQNHVFRVRVNQRHILPDYFATYLRTSEAKQYFLRCAKKTTNLASINMTQLRGLPVPLPSVRLQQKFQDAAKAIYELSAARKKAAHESQSLFGSLVQRAFRGEL
ncbi:MAG: restriction endonuclease subunit S [Gemmataceae bacterium]|nr:restriction endonuclease subunit S [Gemmataceae bacterium]